MSKKLHLACGTDYLDGWLNVDLYAEKVDERFDVAKIPYPDNTFDEIRAFHIIEHFHWHAGNDALKEWCRVLKPNGRLHIETPDFMESCKEFVKSDINGQNNLYGHFFSTPWIPGQQHLFLFTESQLTVQLTWAGFVNINRLPASSNYIQHYPSHIFLNLEAFKKPIA